MLEYQDLEIISTLGLIAGYIVAGFKNKSGIATPRYQQGLKYLLLAIFLMLAIPELIGAVSERVQLSRSMLILDFICAIIGILFWLGSLRNLCLHLIEDDSPGQSS